MSSIICKSFNYKHIIWDWNGTLLNDAWLFVEIMNTILKQRNMSTITLKQYRQIFGFPVKDYYIKLGFDLEKEAFEKCGMEFIKEYEKRRYDADLFPEAIITLSKLNNMGVSHSILSAQHQSLLEDLINYYSIQEYFIQILGLNNHFAHSKTENGANWINNHTVEKEFILMIGDTDHDYEVAQAMGIDCILINNGHHSIDRLQKTGAIILQNLNHVSCFFNI